MHVCSKTIKENSSYICVPGPRLLATAAAMVALSTPMVSLQAWVSDIYGHHAMQQGVMRAIPPANVEYLAFRVARVGVDDTSTEKFVSGIVSLSILRRNLYASAKSCTCTGPHASLVNFIDNEKKLR